MVTVNLMYAIEEEEKRRRLSAAGMRRRGRIGVGNVGCEGTTTMTLAEGMAESDPFAIDQRLETAQRPSVGVEQDLSQRRHLQRCIEAFCPVHKNACIFLSDALGYQTRRVE